jgi:two-component system OmpR family response regulator/two-component system response regulator MprA
MNSVVDSSVNKNMRLLLVEDERKVASFVRQGLEEEDYQVDWASDGRKALARATESSFDLILLDLRLPDISGIEVCRRIRLEDSQVPILMLTALDAVEDRVRGLRAGADDYLPKPFAFDELLARIEALLRRSRLHPESSMYRDGMLELDPVARICAYNGEVVPLTQKEFDLLTFFMSRQGQALSRDDIHREVWGHSFDRGTNLIDVYVGYVRNKLRDSGCRSEIESVRGIGYRYTSYAGDEGGRHG